jgi:hypothetical protein
LITYLNFKALCQQPAKLSVPEPSIKEPIINKAFTVGGMSLQVYDLLMTESGQRREIGIAHLIGLCLTKN